ncbi:MAG: BrnT family toxin [Oligoflexia bacterium]|nr:BrnT family toxin [Oligoflexia bacterium]
MNFEWNELKDQRNYKKHGIFFAEAATALFDPHAIQIPDHDSDPSEERFIALGYSIKSRLLIVVYTIRTYVGKEEVYRIISARKATKTEQKQYEK